MSFHDVLLDPEVTHGVKFTPRFKTTIVRADSGYSQRNIDWDQPLRTGKMSHVIDGYDKLDYCLAFFLNRKGSGYSFKVKDWSDYVVRNAEQGSLGNGDSSTTIFQLTKTYIDDGDYEMVRDIIKPVDGTVEIYVNSILQTESTDYTVNYDTGVLTFTTPPTTGHAIYWIGEFYFVGFFTSDEMDLGMEIPSVGDWENIMIEEALGEM